MKKEGDVLIRKEIVLCLQLPINDDLERFYLYAICI